MDYRNQKVMIGLSGGINSMAVLCWLAQYKLRPDDIYLFYSHFKEHSPETLPFVKAGVKYASKHFKNVIYEQEDNSVLEFFRSKKMIPHPIFAPCTLELKIEPAIKFSSRHNCTIDLIGYVKTEMGRVRNMTSKGANNLFLSKEFPIIHFSDDDCFEIVKKEIGWYPKIYDLIDEKGKRVFKHNNCLPCKNMRLKDYQAVKKYYPEYWKEAQNLATELQKHWGRDKSEYVDLIMVDFGRESWEVETSCKVCNF